LKLTASEIAAAVGGTVIGDEKVVVSQVSKIEDATNQSLCFLSNKKYANHLTTTQAGVVLVNESLAATDTPTTLIQCEHPYVAFCQILIQYFDYKEQHQGIHPTAVIEESAEIGDNVYLGPNAYIGENVKIGDNARIYANTSIYEDSVVGKNTKIYPNCSIYYQTQIGEECIIHSGTVIGSDGFGHAPLPDGSYIKIPQIGNVVIGNKVEIGANCTIDRANMGSTSIGNGSRIDNLVQLAHGVTVGEHTVIAAQTGVSGSSKVGSYVVLAGQVGIAGHLSIADKVQIGAQSGVSNDIKDVGGKYTDSPHLPLGNALRSRALYKNLPQIEQRLRALEKKINTDK
jgi:UDP-3-O-[3-hydroxymyristoyl] glucosamine N-acyltransferase